MKKIVIFLVFFVTIDCFAFSQTNVWENLIYVGARLGGSKHFFIPADDYFVSNSPGSSLESTFPFFSFNAAFQITFQPFSFLAFQTELMYTKNKITHFETGYIQDSGNYHRVEITDMDMDILTVPILAKYIYKTDDFPIAALVGFAGIYFKIPVGEAEMPGNLTLLDYNYTNLVSERLKFETSFGFVFGGGFELELKYGIIFTEVRYGIDFDDTKAVIDQKMTSIFKKNAIHISIGYKIGFIQKQAGQY